MNTPTASGGTLTFNPDHVFMLTGPLPADKAAVFYLHGVGPVAVQVAGTMDAFVPTLPNHQDFTELHFAVNGDAFYANGAMIASLVPATPAQKAKWATANAMIVLGGKDRLITETFPVAVAAINLAGGNL